MATILEVNFSASMHIVHPFLEGHAWNWVISVHSPQVQSIISFRVQEISKIFISYSGLSIGEDVYLVAMAHDV